MKSYTLLFLVFLLSSCSKENLYGPLKLKNGEEVELLVDHRFDAINEVLLKLPERDAASASLIGFGEREPGYTYRVKAKFHFEQEPPQDGPQYWFDFLSVKTKEPYKGNEPFEIELIKSYIPGGPFIQIGKQASNYYYIPEKIQLSYVDTIVAGQLEEIWKNAKEIRDAGAGQLLKWRSVKATVVHDPQKFGKAYLVQQIQFTE